jgi:HEAT repeat protein
MNRTICILMLMFIALSGLAQTTPKIATMYDRLIQPSETNAAAREIVEMAKNDSTARDFLAGKLPSLIIDQFPHDARTVSPVWANAVRLAGQLKIAAAVPALKQALTPETQFIHKGYDMRENETGTTFAAQSRLDFDIVGRALADIGDPSLPVLSDVLSKGDVAERRRVIWILANIKSPAAQKVLQDHLPSESDSGLSTLIKTLLHMPQ